MKPGRMPEIARAAKLDERTREAFLEALRVEVGNVTGACRKMGLPRDTVYGWKKKYPEFSAAWDSIIEEWVDVAERELFRRAVDGTQKEIYNKAGELVATQIEYSDRLLEFLLRGRRPERWNPVSKVAPTTPDGKSPYALASPDDLRALITRLASNPQMLPSPEQNADSDDGEQETSADGVIDIAVQDENETE